MLPLRVEDLQDHTAHHSAANNYASASRTGLSHTVASLEMNALQVLAAAPAFCVAFMGTVVALATGVTPQILERLGIQPESISLFA